MKNYIKYFKNKKILITGHTGFKGSWLTIFLLNCGANILGLSKNIPTKPSLFETLQLKKKIKNKKIDIRDLKKIKKIFLKFDPDYVFHLAAQSIVSKSYKDPLETWTTNLIGTVNILECLKLQKKNSVSVIITSDKTYKNIETRKGYKETDILGGVDPYGASKSSADIAIKSYIKSFFEISNNNKTIGVARAGNVIGGGDWSMDRLIPDCFKKWIKNQKVIIRNPNATRPWQNVIDVIIGYIILAIKFKINKKLHGEAFNFGPNEKKNYKVIEILNLIKKQYPKAQWKIKRNKKRFFENSLLNLDSQKAYKFLNWKSKVNFTNNVKLTIEWYKEFSKKPSNMNKFSLNQINKVLKF